MPFLYIYSPSDFVSGLPAEVGAQAAGTPTFTLTLLPGATGTKIEVTDNDLVFDEVDPTQSLTNAVTIDGTSYSAGTTINSAYDLINTSTGHKVTSFHFGGDGYQQGAVAGIASTVLLTPGTSYTFNTERTSHNQNNLYTDFVTCFADGTLIDTPGGQRRVEDLRPGDRVLVGGGGPGLLRFATQRTLSTLDLLVNPNMRPIRIQAGALGGGLPLRDLWVSPQHRMVISSNIVQRMFGTDQVLVAAKRLLGLPGVDQPIPTRSVLYTHLIFDRHQIVYAEGTPSESFLVGDLSAPTLPCSLREWLCTQDPTPACLIPEGRRQKTLIARHLKNGQPVLGGLGPVVQRAAA